MAYITLIMFNSWKHANAFGFNDNKTHCDRCDIPSSIFILFMEVFVLLSYWLKRIFTFETLSPWKCTTPGVSFFGFVTLKNINVTIFNDWCFAALHSLHIHIHCQFLFVPFFWLVLSYLVLMRKLLLELHVC